jgi:hypothetical protein
MRLISRVDFAVACRAADVATDAYRPASYLFSLEISLANDPGRAFAVLRRWENAVGDETAGGGRAERKDPGRLFDRCFAAVGVLAITINGDVVLVAQGANTPPCPAVTPTGRLAGSIEQRGDRLVWHLSRQGTNQVNDFHIGCPSRLAGAIPLHHQAGMVAALPVDDQLQAFADDVDDDLGYDGSNDLLARFRRGAGVSTPDRKVLRRHRLRCGH